MARLRWTRWIVASIITTLLVEAGAVAPASVVAAELTPPAVEQAAAAGPLAEPAPRLDPADEVTEARTETTATYDIGGGRYAVEVFPDPVFYQPKGSEAFVPIAAGFEPVPGPDKAAVSAAAPTTVTVAPAADPRGFLAVEDEDGFRVAYHPLVTDGAADAAKVIAEPVVRDGIRSDIAEVFPGVDARIFARADGARLFLVLTEALKVPAWTFRLDIPKGASLVPDKETGAIDIVDSDGTRRLVIAAPYAVDSTPDEFTGSGRTTTALHYSLGDADGAPTLTVSIDDAEWLAEAVYPVYVDPTIYNDGTTSYGDAHVNQGNPSFNYGNYQRPDSPYYYEMWLGESPSNSTYYNEAFIRFDLTSIAGKAIDSASLEVRPYHQYYNSPTTVRTWLRRVTASWAENTITWNTKPTVTTTGTVTADSGVGRGSACSQSRPGGRMARCIGRSSTQ